MVATSRRNTGPMSLDCLIFDASDDGEGQGTWEAMASARAGDLPTVEAEIQAVMQWALAHAPGPRGALEEGGSWDADQHTSTDGEWTTITLTLTGPWEWGEELMRAFGANH